MSTSTDLDISQTILTIGHWLGALERLQADPDFSGWRHDEEAGALCRLLRNARARAEHLRFHDEPERGTHLQAIVHALPAARLRQLVGDDGPDEAA